MGSQPGGVGGFAVEDDYVFVIDIVVIHVSPVHGTYMLPELVKPSQLVCQAWVPVGSPVIEPLELKVMDLPPTDAVTGALPPVSVTLNVTVPREDETDVCIELIPAAGAGGAGAGGAGAGGAGAAGGGAGAWGGSATGLASSMSTGSLMVGLGSDPAGAGVML